LEKVACGAFSDIGFVPGGKRRDFCRLRLRKIMVPVEGIEPTRFLGRRILSPLRLPVPPHRLHGMRSIDSPCDLFAFGRI
jgi:hypothetical protein